MNPLTNVKNLQKVNERELELGLIGKKSWHDKYKDSAWIFIGGLPYDLTEGDVLCVFSQYGEIVNINLVRDKKTGKFKGYGFICFEDQRSTILSVDNLNGAKILGRTIRVDHVENYKAPKEFGDEDEITKQIRSEGCAPQLLESDSESGEDQDNVVPVKKLKKEKKLKKKKKEKKKKRSSTDSSSGSDEDLSKLKNKKDNTADYNIKEENNRTPKSLMDSGKNDRVERSQEHKDTNSSNGSYRNYDNKHDNDQFRERRNDYDESWKRDNSVKYKDRRDRSRSPYRPNVDKSRDRDNIRSDRDRSRDIRYDRERSFDKYNDRSPQDRSRRRDR